LSPKINKLISEQKTAKKTSVKKNKNSNKWTTLIHNGVLFPPYYEPNNLSIKIRGTNLRLNPQQEERAYAWVKKIGTPYVEDDVFVSNFFSEFRKILPKDYSNANPRDFDFSEIIDFQEKEKEWKSRPEIKKKLAEQRKKLRETLKEKYGFALVNGKKTEVANYMVEPPSIFMGRGKHPFRGRWKPRVYPHNVTLNLSKKSETPVLSKSGDNWGKRIEDKNSMWLASWTDKLTKKVKYVWLHDSSSIRQQNDKMKYDNAKKLDSRLGKIRRHILKGMKSNDEKIRKISSVCFLIDRLYMRVGDEKDEDEADTVGASTLRVEHIKLSPRKIDFDFLGKDSVPWSKKYKVRKKDDKIFQKNLEHFISGKEGKDLIFNGIKSSDVNRFLGKSVKGLTAKAFRTFHATNEVKAYLEEHNDLEDASPFLKLYHAKSANLKAAIKCNHKRTPPKSWKKTLAKKSARLKIIEAKIPKTDKGKIRHQESILKTKLNIKLAKETRDYNVNTSLRNYIDPRIYKSWSDSINFDWTKVYPKTLQKKFSWVNHSRNKWPPNK
jgi:DNA topoisomerase-1